MQQTIIFGNIGASGGVEAPLSEGMQKYLFNSLVLEIVTNWGFVVNLMERVASNQVKRVDQAEQEWLNFILNNQIQIDQYETSDLFMNAWLKK